MMKAIYCTKYGSPEVLKLTEISKPNPKDNEVRIKIMASAVTSSDVYMRASDIPLMYKIPLRIMTGIRKPRNPILGSVFSGIIDAVGKDIKRFKEGDEVYGLTGLSFGAYAEYKCMKETDSMGGCIAMKPSNITHEEAAVLADGGLLAYQYMKKGNIKKGDSVLIYGASGATGTIAIQLAKSLGAEVTGVCSTKNTDFVKTLGADDVLDYTTNDLPNKNKSFDFILDAVGKRKTSKLKKALKSYLSKDGKMISVDNGTLKLDSNQLKEITHLVENNLIKPVVERSYKLVEIIKAHKHVDQGHKKGGISISMT